MSKSTQPNSNNLNAPSNTNYVSSDASSKGSPELPQKRLMIHSVFGYNGNVRGNIEFINSSEFAYFTAGVGVVQNKQGSQKVFNGHYNAITAIAFDKLHRFVATGDEMSPHHSPYINIWDLNAQPINTIVSEHTPGTEELGHSLKDRIACLAFNDEGDKLVAVGGDDSHSVSILCTEDGWKTYKRCYNASGVTNEIYFCEFLDNNTFYVGGAKVLLCYTINSEDKDNIQVSFKKIYFGKCNIDDLLCGLAYNNQLIVGTKSGHIYMVRDNHMFPTKKYHLKSVNCLSLLSDNQGFISGGSDHMINAFNSDGEKIYGFNLRNAIPLIQHLPDTLIGGVNAISCEGNTLLVGTNKCNIFEISMVDNVPSNATVLVEGHDCYKICGCTTHPTDVSEVVSVGEDCEVYLWDIKTGLPSLIYHLPNKSRCVSYHHTKPNLAIGLGGKDANCTHPGSENGGFIILDRDTLRVLFEDYDLSDEWIDVIKYSLDDKYLVLGSHDHKIYIYSAENDIYQRIHILDYGHSFITHIDFSNDNQLIRICYGDYQLLYIDVEQGELVNDNELIKLKEWSTNNCINVPNVQGIWKDANDRTDINLCCTNPDQTLLVAADDTHSVRLYKYPCIQKDAVYRPNNGHSSKILCAQFTFDGRGLVTCGGDDHTVIYWDVTNL